MGLLQIYLIGCAISFLFFLPIAIFHAFEIFMIGRRFINSDYHSKTGNLKTNLAKIGLCSPGYDLENLGNISNFKLENERYWKSLKSSYFGYIVFGPISSLLSFISAPFAIILFNDLYADKFSKKSYLYKVLTGLPLFENPETAAAFNHLTTSISLTEKEVYELSCIVWGPIELIPASIRVHVIPSDRSNSTELIGVKHFSKLFQYAVQKANSALILEGEFQRDEESVKCKLHSAYLSILGDKEPLFLVQNSRLLKAEYSEYLEFPFVKLEGEGEIKSCAWAEIEKRNLFEGIFLNAFKSGVGVQAKIPWYFLTSNDLLEFNKSIQNFRKHSQGDVKHVGHQNLHIMECEYKKIERFFDLISDDAISAVKKSSITRIIASMRNCCLMVEAHSGSFRGKLLLLANWMGRQRRSVHDAYSGAAQAVIENQIEERGKDNVA